MTDKSISAESHHTDVYRVSVFTIGLILIRYRRLFFLLMLLGAAIGVASAYLLPRRYTSRVTFIPQSSSGLPTGLTLAAGQFGFRVPRESDEWGTLVYVELLQSRAILESVALDSFVVPEISGEPVPLMSILEIDGSTSETRLAKAIHALRSIVRVGEDPDLGAVRVSVVTNWATLSRMIAQNLVDAVNRFNVEVRRTQAAAERRFTEDRVALATAELRTAEDRMQSFLQRNRAVNNAAELVFDRDRLQRQVDLRQQVLSTLLQSLEEAKIREVRDTPVITEIQSAALALRPEPRGTVLKMFLGLTIGLFAALATAICRERFKEARRRAATDAKEFFDYLDRTVMGRS